TKIKLLDGTERTFAELAALPAGEVFHVYSVDAAGRIVVGEGHSSRITKRGARVIELTFDDGSRVRCTPEHRFLLRDGSWEEAQHRTVDDSLMAGHFDYAPVKERTNAQIRVRQRKIAGYAARLLAEVGREGLTPAVFDERRSANWVPTSTRALAYFDGFDELVSVAATHNHRVVAVRAVEATADVYDITVNEHHNFMLANGCVVHNSVDGDPAAAYRYTEARLTRVSMEMLADIEKNTVDTAPNFDDRLQEPKVLPSAIPNLVVNGSSGIAVGMATNIPPHNLREVVAAIIALIDNPEMTPGEIRKLIKGPDFPTGGYIYGRAGIKDYQETGRGRIVMRARVVMEGKESSNKSQIVINELPYQINKAKL